MPAAPLTPCAAAADRAESALLLCAGALLAAIWFGHFVKPHGDFFEFRETGRALLAGELPETFKRAPLFPLAVACTGNILAALGAARPFEQRAAELLNAALLPLNALLLLVALRRVWRPAAAWLAAWFLLLPLSAYAAAHCLAEGLLTGLLLACVLVANVGQARAALSGAYVLASLALLTRYDAIGGLLAVAIADAGHGAKPLRVALRACVAALPTTLWLGLTALYWRTRAADHYVAQLIERPGFDLGWSLDSLLRCLLDVDRLSLPAPLADWSAALHAALLVSLALLAACGALCGVLRREPLLCGCVTVLAPYILIHAAFPFREFRFGYPPAPLALLLIAAACREIPPLLRRRLPSAWVRRALAALLLVAALAVLIGEGQRAWSVAQLRRGFDSAALAVIVDLTLALLVAGLNLARWRGGLAGGAATVCLIALALVHGRAVRDRMGTGREYENAVAAARWVAARVAAHEGVLSAWPALLRMHCGDLPRGRFIAFTDVVADDWRALRAELEARGVAYIIWHDQLFAEQGDYYANKWRLQRFEHLSNPASASSAGLRAAAEFAERPNLWIYRIVPGE